MKVLIVDDSKAMRMLIRRALRQAGYDWTVEEASNGVEAIQATSSGGIDLVISDWNMPEMNGIEFLTKLREGGSKVRFGFVTSEGTEEIRTRARDAGADFLVCKPFTPDALKEAIG